MDGPDFFILCMIEGLLAVALAACMLTGAIWLIVGWRKKSRRVQFLSALPFGIGVFVLAPILFLVLLFTGISLIAGAWRGSPQPSSAPPNPAAGKAGFAHLSAIDHYCPDLPGVGRSAGSTHL